MSRKTRNLHQASHDHYRSLCKICVTRIESQEVVEKNLLDPVSPQWGRLEFTTDTQKKFIASLFMVIFLENYEQPSW